MCMFVPGACVPVRSPERFDMYKRNPGQFVRDFFCLCADFWSHSAYAKLGSGAGKRCSPAAKALSAAGLRLGDAVCRLGRQRRSQLRVFFALRGLELRRVSRLARRAQGLCPWIPPPRGPRRSPAQRVLWGEEEGTELSGIFGVAGNGACGVSSNEKRAALNFICASRQRLICICSIDAGEAEKV